HSRPTCARADSCASAPARPAENSSPGPAGSGETPRGLTRLRARTAASETGKGGRVDRLYGFLFEERTRGWVPLVIRLVTGVFFVSVSLGKFFDHASEAHDFDRYGIPIPATSVVLVGVLELVCGIALVLGLGTRIAAAALAANMVGAIATAGRVEGG